MRARYERTILYNKVLNQSKIIIKKRLRTPNRLYIREMCRFVFYRREFFFVI